MARTFSQPSVPLSRFAMTPRADVPRSKLRMDRTYKTTYKAFGGNLYPVFLQEVLPGDSFRVRATAFIRLATLVVPVMDNLYTDVFFFFVPNRLVWDKWKRFMGERTPDPTTTIDLTIPQCEGPVGGADVGSLSDYFGIPVEGQVDPAEFITVSAIPFRGYTLIWNEWFRDQNLASVVPVPLDDGPDTTGGIGTDHTLRPRFKRGDYLTSLLPWPQKINAATIPLTGLAPVLGIGAEFADATPYPDAPVAIMQADGNVTTPAFAAKLDTSAIWLAGTSNSAGGAPALFAKLDSAQTATINALRTAFQIQKMLERDARGGTRYTEIIRAQFGVVSPDARMQRPEYLGGGSFQVGIQPVTQNSGTDITGSTTPLATLSGVGAGVGQAGFGYSATEHGYIFGLISTRADMTYQQGIERHWTKFTRFDYYTPVLAHLGEQAVLKREIFMTGDSAGNDGIVFGYGPRWEEYRYGRSMITGLFRSTAAGTLDVWHLAQSFDATVALNLEFMVEDPPVERVSAVPSEPDFMADLYFQVEAVRPLPMHSVPGLADHF